MALKVTYWDSFNYKTVLSVPARTLIGALVNFNYVDGISIKFSGRDIFVCFKGLSRNLLLVKGKSG